MPIKTGKTYRGRVRLKDYPTKTKDGFKTRNEAKAWELRTAERLKNPPLEAQKLTFGKVQELWLINCSKRWKRRTCMGKGYITACALDFWGYDPYMDELSALMIENFLNSVESGKTANRYKRELRNFFNFAIDRGLAVENFAKKISSYKEKKYKRYVPPKEDIETAKAYAEPLEHDIIVAIYNTLARAGEIRNLKWTDVNLEKKEITLWTGKRSENDRKDDTLEMTDTLFNLLKEKEQNKTHEEYVFSRNGEKLTSWWLNEIMKRIHLRAKEAGENYKYFTLHCIRHHVAALLSYKLSLIEISKILRHRNVTTTDIYLRSLVTIKTKGIRILDDIQKIEKADIISFHDAVNKR